MARPGDELLISLASAMRDSLIFENPDLYIPGRWLEGSRLNQLLNFGVGSKVCPAKNFFYQFTDLSCRRF